MAQNVKTSSRSTKLFLASLSIAAGMSGWAWLTATQAAPEYAADLPSDTTETANVQVLQADTVALPPRSNMPNLASLPVRGLREVGDAMPEAVASQSDPSVGQNSGGGGGKRAQLCFALV